jgi:hypothetical protein
VRQLSSVLRCSPSRCLSLNAALVCGVTRSGVAVCSYAWFTHPWLVCALFSLPISAQQCACEAASAATNATCRGGPESCTQPANTERVAQELTHLAHVEAEAQERLQEAALAIALPSDGDNLRDGQRLAVRCNPTCGTPVSVSRNRSVSRDLPCGRTGGGRLQLGVRRVASLVVRTVVHGGHARASHGAPAATGRASR